MFDEDKVIQHYGIKGMKWGVRRYQPYPKGSRAKGEFINEKTGDVTLKKGTEINRLVRTEWLDKEKKLKGHAYATYKKEDLDRYKMFATMFGMDKKTVQMSFEAKRDLVSPNPAVRAETFIELMKNNPKARKAMEDSTRSPFNYLRKKHLDNLDIPKSAKKAYDKFAYNLVSQKDLRDPYFDSLKKKGYNMVFDDADINGNISKAPIIVFERENSLDYKTTKNIDINEVDRK